MTKTVKILFITSILLLVAFVVLMSVYPSLTGHVHALTVEEIVSMPAEEGAYRSINNWLTVEETSFKGVKIHQLLEREGVLEEGATLKFIAPDGYFWPAVGDALYLEDMLLSNTSGVYPIIAYEMDGDTLDPEPEGTGPLRLVLPQYDGDQLNKPSWVYNLRLIEVGPLSEEAERPDPKDVPLGELWLYGEVPATHPFPLWLPLVLGGLGVLLLGASVLIHARDRMKRKPVNNSGVGGSAALLLVLLLTCLLWVSAAPVSRCSQSGSGSFVFSREDLGSMPAYSAHYTFLKSQPPYTYYEADYTGVTLSYLLEERLSLVSGASGIKVKATDGYEVTLSLSQFRDTYPGGLKAIIAYSKDGEPLVGDEGPFRLIVPQAVPGNKEEGGEPNTPLCARMVNAIEVLPSDGTPPETPSGSLAVYGMVEAAPAPSPAPSPSPAPAPENPQPSPEESAQASAPGPGPQEEPDRNAFGEILEVGTAKAVFALAVLRNASITAFGPFALPIAILLSL